MHDAFGNALVVEVGDFLAEVEVLHERRAALAGLQRVVGVGNPHTLVGGQVLTFGARLELVELLLFGQSIEVVVVVVGGGHGCRSTPPASRFRLRCHLR